MNTNDVTALTRIYAKGINEMIDEYITLDELGGIFADLLSHLKVHRVIFLKKSSLLGTVK